MEKWEYYGLFIDKETHDKLIDVLVDYHWIGTLNDSKRKYMDHCTLLHISQSSTPSGHPLMCSLNSLLKKGDVKHNITINAIGISEKAMAFRVVLPKKSYVSSFNKNPHITICTFNEGKPVESNNITKWHSLDSPIKIETTLKRV